MTLNRVKWSLHTLAVIVWVCFSFHNVEATFEIVYAKIERKRAKEKEQEREREREIEPEIEKRKRERLNEKGAFQELKDTSLSKCKYTIRPYLSINWVGFSSQLCCRCCS